MSPRSVSGEAVHDLVWKLVFRELSQEEMLQLSYEIVLCSLMDQDCRSQALSALKQAVEQQKSSKKALETEVIQWK